MVEIAGMKYCVIYNESTKHSDNDYFSYFLEEISKFAENVNNIAELNQNMIEEISDFDRIVFINDKVFGPLFSIKDIMAEMEQQICDYWGITDFSIEQGYFIVLNKSSIQYICKQLQECNVAWNIDNMIKCLRESDLKCRYYIKDNFLGDDRYVKDEIYLTEKLIKYRKYPFVPIQCFCGDTYGNDLENNARSTLGYITKNTNYDSNLIWDYLLAHDDIGKIRKILHLNYVFPLNKMVDSSSNNTKKVLIIAHLFFEDLLQGSLDYLSNAPEYADVCITVSDEALYRVIEQEIYSRKKQDKWKVIIKDNRGRDVSALLVAARTFVPEYEYVCFIHDKKSNQMRKKKFGFLFGRTIWDNLLKSDGYIDNIITCFEENPRLGMLAPPIFIYGEYLFFAKSNLWMKNLENTRKFLELLNIDIEIDINSDIISTGTAFWLRTSAFRQIFEYQFEYDFFPEEPMPSDGTISHAIERAWPYIAQFNGYYSGTVMNTEFISMRDIEYEKVVHAFLGVCNDMKVSIRDIKDIESNNILNFYRLIDGSEKIYVYGTGEYSKRIVDVLEKKDIMFEAYIVTDAKEKVHEFRGKKVCLLSEIMEKEEHDKIAILLAMSGKNQDQVIGKLQEAVFDRYIDGKVVLSMR